MRSVERVRGRVDVIAIHFERGNDCKELLKRLQTSIQRYTSYGLKGDVKTKDYRSIFLTYYDDTINFFDSFHPLLVSILTDYVIETKEDEWLLDIIESLFFFTDAEEKKQIVTIARTIMEGDRDGVPSKSYFLNRRTFIYNAFSKHIKEETTFYFDAFLTFRLKEYGEMLIDCVELAIDEYMFEQEYQTMIEQFRHYIQKGRNKYPIIHVVHTNTFTFYDEAYRPITKRNIQKHLERDLVFEKGVAIEEMVLSPLVSLNPSSLYVYTNVPDHSVILSIQAIFQEKMTLLPLALYDRKKRSTNNQI